MRALALSNLPSNTPNHPSKPGNRRSGCAARIDPPIIVSALTRSHPPAFVLLFAGCAANPSADCERRAEQVAREMNALVEQLQRGCRSNADCIVFEPHTACVSTCPQPLHASAATAAKGQLEQLSTRGCAGLNCRLALDCAAVQTTVCVSGDCVRGLADGGPAP